MGFIFKRKKEVVSKKETVENAEFTKFQIQNSLRIIRDSMKIISETKDPDVFFERYRLIVRHCNEIQSKVSNIENFDIDFHNFVEQKQSVIHLFLTRYLESVLASVNELKSVSAKQRHIQSFFDSLEPYKHEMDKENIAFYTQQYNLYSSGIVNAEESLVQDGDLPAGWVYRHRDIIEPINEAFSRLLREWSDNRQSDLQTRYNTLRALVTFLQSTKEHCRKMGLCYETWFSRLIASDEYISKREIELKDLTDHYDEYLEEERQHNAAKQDLNKNLLSFLAEHPGILQKDVYAAFSPLIKADIQELLYFWDKDDIIERVKIGNTYQITVK